MTKENRQEMPNVSIGQTVLINGRTVHMVSADPEPNEAYLPDPELARKFQALLSRPEIKTPLVVSGPSGIGKTDFVRFEAKKAGFKVFKAACHAGTELESLTFSLWPAGNNNFELVGGAIPASFTSSSPCLLLLDDASRLSVDVQAGIKCALDGSDYIESPLLRGDKILRNDHVSIVLTCETKELSMLEEFLDNRVCELRIGAPGKERLLDILKKRFPGAPANFDDAMRQFVLDAWERQPILPGSAVLIRRCADKLLRWNYPDGNYTMAQAFEQICAASASCLRDPVDVAAESASPSSSLAEPEFPF